MSTSNTFQGELPAPPASDSPQDPGRSAEPEGLATGGNYCVKLHAFEGPLDLLLHLIRQNEVEITEIPIAQIAKQYLEYLEVMRDLDLDVAAEYLVMAATLAHIKSRMLLPPSEEEGDAEEIDPRAELVARLLEYQRYKEVAESLSKRRWLGRDVFNAQRLQPERVPENEREIEVGLFELIEAFRLMLENAKDDEQEYVHVVESEEVSVRDQMIWVMSTLVGNVTIEFSQLFVRGGAARPSRANFVATFLAILELTRLEALAIYQGVDDEGSPEGPIRLRSSTSTSDLSWDERISELM